MEGTPRRGRRSLAGAGVSLLLASGSLAACTVGDAGAGDPVATATATVTVTVTAEPTPDQAAPSPREDPGPAPALLAAGDIATCDDEGDEQTAALLDELDGVVAPLGDLAYDDGTPEEFAECYAPSWGRHRDRTLPVPGNHDYLTEDAAGYFGFFGDAAVDAFAEGDGARDPGRGYYSTDLGSWHVVVLNSNCSDAGGCSEGSPQETWLREDLAAAAEQPCTAAMWHHPRFSSGEHGSDEDYTDLWRALYDHGAEVVLNGHDHNYERFAPQTPDGQPDEQYGIVQFVVGTGGKGLRDMDEPIANSVVRNSDSHGVLELRLEDTSADFRFHPVEGADFTDSGTITCHDAPEG